MGKLILKFASKECFTLKTLGLLILFASQPFQIFSQGITKKIASKSHSTRKARIFSGYTASLVSPYHTSEGVVLPVGHDTLIHIFNINTENTHVSNTGKIVKRYSYNAGRTWTAYSLVYDSEYDDRNIIGAVINGRIALIFRRLKATTSSNGEVIDVGSIYSDNKGIKWSSYRVIPYAPAQPIGPIVKGGDGKWHATINTTGNTKIYSSNDGSTWSFQSEILQANIDECALAYIGNNSMILLSRDEATNDSTWFIHTSTDNGNNWTYKGRTLTAGNELGCNRTPPYITYDKVQHKVIGMFYTRNVRPESRGNDSLYIYVQSADSAFDNKWALQWSTKRPYPNKKGFYGYLTCAQLSDGSLIGLLADRKATKNINGEITYFYQFKVNPRVLRK